MTWYTLFPKILNMSLVSGFIILVVLLTRLLLRKSPKIYSWLLWSAVLFRLLCPISLPSPMSVVTVARPGEAEEIDISATVSYIPAAEPDFYQIVSYDPASDSYTADDYSPTVGFPLYTTRQYTDRVSMAVVTALWAAGAVGMMLYGIVSAIRLNRKLVGAVPYGKNILQSDYISVPFAAGIIKPKIYIPSAMNEEELPYVLLHEQYHIRHLDHIIKYLAYLALCIHWFNPLVWIAFLTAEKDMEMRCDEGVLKQLGEDAGEKYSTALLHFSAGRKGRTSVSPAFSEGNIRTRIRSALNFRKPSKAKTVFSIILTLVILAGCAVTPKTKVLTTEGTPSFEAIPLYTSIYSISEMTEVNTYVSDACIYMNPLSSTMSFGDTGYRYLVTENSFARDDRQGGVEILNDSITWEWQEFPWTDGEWNDFFVPSVMGPKNLLKTYDEVLYQKINNRYCLLRLDGAVWLVHFSKNSAMGEYIWDIHSLKPESACGMALWEFKPYYSSVYPAFAFDFAGNPEKVSVFCYGGEMIGRSGTVTTGDVYRQYGKEELVYWSPQYTEGLIAAQGKIHVFIEYEDRIREGNIYIENMGNNTYSATIVGSGLRMEQSTEFPGGIIVDEYYSETLITP